MGRLGEHLVAFLDEGLGLRGVDRLAAERGAVRHDDQLTACRAGLDTAGPDHLPAARAAACELAMRAAAALVVTQGARAILADQDAQRLAREALFLLVFGSRPTIKQALAGLLTEDGVAGPAGLPGDSTEGAAWRTR